MTPLQMAHAYSIFANGGGLSLSRLLPHPLMMRRLDGSSNLIWLIGSSKSCIELLVWVVLRSEQPCPVTGVGGKTGTVHKVGEGGYLDDRYVALFAGIAAPVEAPRYVCGRGDR